MFKTPRDIGSSDAKLGLCVNVDDNQIGPKIFRSVEVTREETVGINYKYKQVNLLPILSSPIRLTSAVLIM